MVVEEVAVEMVVSLDKVSDDEAGMLLLAVLVVGSRKVLSPRIMFPNFGRERLTSRQCS